MNNANSNYDRVEKGGEKALKKRWISFGTAALLGLAVYSWGDAEALAGRNGSSAGKMWQSGKSSGQSSGDMAQVRSRIRQQNLEAQRTGISPGRASGVCDGTGLGSGKGRRR